MAAVVKKIRPDINATPEMLLGMMLGYVDQIKEFAGVIIWDDDSVQVVNTPMKMKELSYCATAFQLELFDQMRDD